jgi:hypothetical protein
MAAEYVLACDSADFDTATRTCSAPHYELAPMGWPALSAADAQVLGSKIVLVLVLAWCFRRLRNVSV